jgi:hypothetical protein
VSLRGELEAALSGLPANTPKTSSLRVFARAAHLCYTLALSKTRRHEVKGGDMLDIRRLLISIVIGSSFWASISVKFFRKYKKMVFRIWRIPALILIFFLIDLALGLGYIVNELVGRPYEKLTLLLDLSRESNLPTWYSSMQWFCVAIFLGLFAHSNFRLAQIRSWLLPIVSLLFLALSVDEVARIHEWLGEKTDILLPGGSRANTLLHQTGIWMFVIGIPFLATFVWLFFSIRMYFQYSPNALIKLFVGMLTTLSGALGFETLTNFVSPGSMYGILRVFAEEFCEIVGGTIVLWGSYELLVAHGFAYWLAPYSLGAKVVSKASVPSCRGEKKPPETKAGQTIMAIKVVFFFAILNPCFAPAPRALEVASSKDTAAEVLTALTSSLHVFR